MMNSNYFLLNHGQLYTLKKIIKPPKPTDNDYFWTIGNNIVQENGKFKDVPLKGNASNLFTKEQVSIKVIDEKNFFYIDHFNLTWDGLTQASTDLKNGMNGIGVELWYNDIGRVDTGSFRGFFLQMLGRLFEIGLQTNVNTMTLESTLTTQGSFIEIYKKEGWQSCSEYWADIGYTNNSLPINTIHHIKCEIRFVATNKYELIYYVDDELVLRFITIDANVDSTLRCWFMEFGVISFYGLHIYKINNYPTDNVKANSKITNGNFDKVYSDDEVKALSEITNGNFDKVYNESIKCNSEITGGQFL